MKISSLLAIAVLFVLLFYLSIAGILVDYKQTLHLESEKLPRETTYYKKIPFRNKAKVDAVIVEEKFDKYYPQFLDLPDLVIFLISAMALGSMGVLLRELFDYNRNPTLFRNIMIGAIVGMCVWLIGSYTPKLITGVNSFNKTYIFVLSIIAGTYTVKFVDWLGKLFDRIFK